MPETGIIRLEANGPTEKGLTPLELCAEDFQSDLPRQFWHIYFEDPGLGLTVGVWTTTSMQEAFGPYPGDEFMHILEGQVLILEKDNNATVINEGETFVVRNGIPVSWKQNGFCRKLFMTFLAPNTAPPALETAEGGIVILDENKLESQKSSSANNGNESQKEIECFANNTGTMRVGIWESDPFESDLEPFPCHEFVQMLSGTVTITDANGKSYEFIGGDCFFIPEGTICSWKCDTPVRKYYCNLVTQETD
ncbi:MAG: cupin domain-containing protein [Rhizobiaceae bacterium]